MTLFEFEFNEIDYNYRGKVIKLKSKNFDLILSVIAKSLIYEGVDKNGYTIINSRKFVKVYARYSIYIDYLIYKGVIERDYYVVDKKSFGYRFSEPFKQKVKIKRIIYYQDDINKTNEMVVDQKSVYIEPHVLKRLQKDYKSCTFNYDLTQNQLEKTYDEWDNFIDIGKWFRNNLCLHKWLKGYRTFSFASNRLYTNFTSLSSHVRKSNIKLNDENLVEFDIHNSFPLMLAMHLKYENSEIINDYDYEQYCSSVINHTFYSELTAGLNSIRNSNKRGCEADYSSRLLSKSEVKQLFQIYLNCDNNRHPYLYGIRPYIIEYMSFKYPIVHEQILELKKTGKGNVYNTLVRIETQFIFGVLKELYDQFDDIKILTCHDAIYVPLSFKERVQVIWDEKMKDLVKDLPNDECEDDLDLGDCSISIFEEDDNSMYKEMRNEKDISFLDEEDYLL